MKILIKHTIPILVILIWLVLAIIIGLASCTKDSLPGVAGPQIQSPEVHKIAATGDAIDLSLNAYSSMDPAATYDLTVDRKLIGSFRLQQNENLKWHLDQLNAGTYRINIYIGFSNNATPSFCNFQFNIKDRLRIQSVTATRIDQRNYGFDLVIEK
jgi:hypothetical protein